MNLILKSLKSLFNNVHTNLAKLSNRFDSVKEMVTEIDNKLAEISPKVGWQADYNQNDETKLDYIKNRPFYEEKRIKTIAEEQTIDLSSAKLPSYEFAENIVIMDEYDYLMATQGNGENIRIVFDGVIYDTKTCRLALDGDEYMGAFITHNGHGIAIFLDYPIVQDFDDLGGIHTLVIYKPITITKPIESKYLPEALQFGSKEIMLFEDTITTDQYGNYQNNALQASSATSYIVTIGNKQYVSTPTYIDPDGAGIYLMDGSERHGSIVAGYLWLSTNYYPPSSSYYVKLSSREIQQIDEIYLPDSVAMDEDVVSVQTAANNAQTTADSKMDKTNPVGTGSFSMNRKANTTVGNYSHATGYQTTASGNYSHAEGQGTTASNVGAHAEGIDTVASGRGSHAENAGTAKGEYSHAESNGTAIGTQSHAEGCSEASGSQSHAEGFRTIAASHYQHTQGKYNIEDATNTYAHIVGNGTNNTNRSNAHTLDWVGNAWYQGDVYVGSTSGNNKDVGSKKLATEEYVLANINTSISGSGSSKVNLYMERLPSDLTELKSSYQNCLYHDTALTQRVSYSEFNNLLESSIVRICEIDNGKIFDRNVPNDYYIELSDVGYESYVSVIKERSTPDGYVLKRVRISIWNPNSDEQ